MLCSGMKGVAKKIYPFQITLAKDPTSTIGRPPGSASRGGSRAKPGFYCIT